MRFKNKVALVTGSSRGIGAATAKLFAQEGANVVICYRENKAAAEQLAKELGQDQALAVGADLTQEAEVKALVAKALGHFGRLDILVNNAGEIIRPGDWQTDPGTWRSTIDANLTSAWLVTKHAAPRLEAGGAIVNITSVFGFTGAAAVLPYTAAKGGLVTLTRAMAKELAPKLRVNAVAPSNAWTDMTKGAGDELIEAFKQQTPLGRIADPDEIAKAVLFLASSDASYITGETLMVDGGFGLR